LGLRVEGYPDASNSAPRGFGAEQFTALARSMKCAGPRAHVSEPGAVIYG